MRAALWATSLAVVLFLSLWPFRFDPRTATEAAWLDFARSWGWTTRIGDAIGNVALFVPVGVLGMLTFPRLPKLQRAAIVAAAAFVVAVVGQAGQVILPARTATLVDVTWNMVGLLPGILVGLVPWDASATTASFRARLQVLPWLILSIWVAYRLAPFVPSLDWQLMKDNLKLLWREPIPELPDAIITTAAWLAAGYLMQAGDARRRFDLLFPLLMAVVMSLEVVIVRGGGLAAHNVAGGLLALGLWFGLARWVSRPALLVMPALAVAIAVNGLWPFVFAPQQVRSFHWLPFAGLLAGSMWFNLLAATYKFYLYSAFCFTLYDLVRSWRITALTAAAYVLAIELLQCYQPSHFPEITDPILVLLACIAGAAFAPGTDEAGRVKA